MTGGRGDDVVVVGGGVGGLAAAIRLRVAGHRVTVLERHDTLGGKLGVHVRDGFHFDTGPSLVTMPQVFDELFRLAGTSLADEVEMIRLDPQFRYQWRDGSTMTMGDDGPTGERADARAWRSFVDHGAAIWDVSERTFFAGPMSGPLSLMRRLRSPRDLLTIDPFRSLDRVARRYFDDPRLVQWAGRYATYSGSSPFAAPATLACIPAIESRHGCWYPTGGLGRLRDAIVDVAIRVGVDLRTGAEVVAIRRDGSKVAGIELADGTAIPAAVVVANADATHLYRDLLPDQRALRRVRRAEPSTSGFVVMAGVSGTTELDGPPLGHHNIWFSGDNASEFEQLAAGAMADDPTVYACVSSTSDPSQAPAGDENWFILVNAPAGATFDTDRRTEHVLAILAAHGVDLRERLRFTETITPSDLESQYRSPGGSIYGTSSNGRRAAFVRPANRGSIAGLYLVGGSSHPGGGLPLVTMGARIVADMIATDRR